MFEWRLSLEVSKEKLHSRWDHKAWGCWNQITGLVGVAEEATWNFIQLRSAQAKANYEPGQHGTGAATPGHIWWSSRRGVEAVKLRKKRQNGNEKQRELQEQEWKKQLELEKLEKQREIGAWTEEERRKEIERREVIYFIFYFIFYFQGNHFFLISGYILLDKKGTFCSWIFSQPHSYSFLPCMNLNLPSPVKTRGYLLMKGLWAWQLVEKAYL